MYLLDCDRIKLMNCLPKGGVVAEVGVALGWHARHMFDQLQPRKLHLIDPWRHIVDPLYEIDENNTSDQEGDRRHAAVRQLFADEISQGRVEIHRGTSGELAGAFPDGHFDLVYIDGNHTHEACLNDLDLFRDKVKESGFLCGHDFQTIEIARRHNNGVVEAVNEFLARERFAFLALTFEEAPTYVLTRNPNSLDAMNFVATALRDFRVMAEIVNPERKVFRQLEVASAPQRYVFSFD